MATITSILSTDNLSQGRTKINTNFTNLNTDKLEFSQNGDFYKYTISRTVDGSGNMTITYLNYLGATPSASAPMKVQIGDTVMTITSALSTIIPAGTNWMNLGSAELATKEVDLFTYIAKSTTAGITLGVARIPNGNVTGDFNGTTTNEKYISNWSDLGTAELVNIGRFNAILSAGAGYTWSVPATSVIVNRPSFISMLETGRLASVGSANGLPTTTTIVDTSASTAPTSGQVLTAISSTAATWQTPSGGGAQEIRIRIPGEMVADTANYQGVFWRNNTGASITISNVAFAVAIAAAGSGAAAAFNVYKSSGTAANGINTSAVNLFTSAVDLTTTNLSATNVPNNTTVEDGRWVSLRCTSSAGATNKASDCEIIISYS